MSEKKADVDVKSAVETVESFKGDTKSQWRYKLAQSIALVCLWISMGYYDSLIASTLPDLRDRLEAGNDQVSTARAMKQLGSLVGGLVAGLLSDRFTGRNNFFLGLCLCLAGIVVICHPWSTYVVVLGVLYFLEGMAQGGMDSVGNAFVLSLWGKKADPAVHSVHFGYTFGSIFTPLTTAPFLSPDVEKYNCTSDPNSTITTTVCDEDLFSSTPSNSRFPEGSRIEIPYAIAGSVALLMGFVFFAFQIKGPPKDTHFFSPPISSWRQIFSPGSCAGGQTATGGILIALFIIFYIIIQGQGAGMGTLGFTYATETALDFTKQEAAMWDLANRVTAMASRLLSIILSGWVPSNIVVFTAVIGQTCAVALISFVGINNKTAFWVFTIFNSLFSAPAWGAGYAFVDKYIVLYAFVVALSAAGAGISGFAFTTLSGYMYDHVSRESIFYLSTGMCALWVVVLILMQIVGLRLGNRHTRPAKDEPVVEYSKNEPAFAYDNEVYSVKLSGFNLSTDL